MVLNTATAQLRIEEQAGPFWSAPRPCPDPVDLGFRWSKEGRYWIAFTPTPGGHAVMSLFSETADIPRRT